MHLTTQVHLVVSKNPANPEGQVCEVLVKVGGEKTVIAKKSSRDLYSSIDLCARSVKQQLSNLHERIVKVSHVQPALGDPIDDMYEYGDDDDPKHIKATATAAEIDKFAKTDNFVIDEYSGPPPTITKVNSFPLNKPMSVQDAIFALDYIDHVSFLPTRQNLLLSLSLTH
jgi:hypothetical protein